MLFGFNLRRTHSAKDASAAANTPNTSKVSEDSAYRSGSMADKGAARDPTKFSADVLAQLDLEEGPQLSGQPPIPEEHGLQASDFPCKSGARAATPAWPPATNFDSTAPGASVRVTE